MIPTLAPTTDQEMLWIHSHEDLIEKTLGSEEGINVSKESIIAFTQEVSFEQCTWSNDFVRIKGPGRIYMETCRGQQENGFQTNFEPKELTR